MMRLIYSGVLFLLLPFVLLRLLWLGRRNPAYRERWAERLGFARSLPADRPVLWLHAVSVGEVLAAQPLLHALRTRHPDACLLVTTTTPTGAATVERRLDAGVEHRYFPYDLPFAIRHALRRLHPHLVLVMETEIWPNFFAECRRLEVPVMLVNARLSERSLRGYRLLSGLTRDTLRSVTMIAAQSDTDARRLIALGAPEDRVRVTGNLKFDVQLPRSVVEQGQALRRFLSARRPVWIAASTHAGEESIVIEAFGRVRAVLPDCLLILAPRHPERGAEVEGLCNAAGLRAVRRSTQDRYDPATRVFVLDSLGELPVFYACADVAFVGGSLVRTGGHNLLEPASLGVPVVSGPHLQNFAAIAEWLLAARAMLTAGSADELADAVTRLLQDANMRFAMGEAARAVFRRHRGSTETVLSMLDSLLPPPGGDAARRGGPSRGFRADVRA